MPTINGLHLCLIPTTRPASTIPTSSHLCPLLHHSPLHPLLSYSTFLRPLRCWSLDFPLTRIHSTFSLHAPSFFFASLEFFMITLVCALEKFPDFLLPLIFLFLLVPFEVEAGMFFSQRVLVVRSRDSDFLSFHFSFSLSRVSPLVCRIKSIFLFVTFILPISPRICFLPARTYRRSFVLLVLSILAFSRPCFFGVLDPHCRS